MLLKKVLLLDCSFLILQVEGMYTKCHAAIRADPAAKEKTEKQVKTKRWNRAKMSKTQRMDRVKQLKTHFLKKMQEDDE